MCKYHRNVVYSNERTKVRITVNTLDQECSMHRVYDVCIYLPLLFIHKNINEVTGKMHSASCMYCGYKENRNEVKFKMVQIL